MSKCSKKMRKFTHVLLFAVLGIVSGLVLGFGFGILSGFITDSLFNEEGLIEMGSFLGMGIGSVVGGVFGGVIGYKE